MFLAPALDQATQLKLTEIKEKVGSLERLLERDVAKQPNHSSFNQRMALPDDADDDLPPNEDEKVHSFVIRAPFSESLTKSQQDLEPSPLASVDAAYEVDGDDDDLLDLGIQMGKMRITERIGGFFRPKISQEVRSCDDYTLAIPKTSFLYPRDRLVCNSPLITTCLRLYLSC